MPCEAPKPSGHETPVVSCSPGKEQQLKQHAEAAESTPANSLDRSSTEPPARIRHSLPQRLQGCLFKFRRMVVAHPMVLITPLLALVALLAMGIVGVIILSDAVEEQRQADAMNEAVARGIVIAEKMQMASIPVHGLANFVLGTPNYWWPSIYQSFNSTSEGLIDLLSGSGLDTSMRLQIAPASIMMASYPKPNRTIYARPMTTPINLLADTSQREPALIAIRTQQLFLAGPYMMRSGNLAAAIRLPVFVNGSYGPDQAFGLPADASPPYGNTPYNCSECYGQQRFWGFCISTLNWDVVRAASKVDDLYNVSGYSFRLTRPAEGNETDAFSLAESPDMDGQTFEEFGQEVLEVRFQVLTNWWTLTLSQQGGWDPSWRTPMLVVVVVVAVVVSLLIGLVMGWNCRLMETTTRLEVTAGKLQEEKERMDALLVRQFDLIQCFADISAPASTGSQILGLKIDRLRSSLQGHRTSSSIKPPEGDKIDLHELLGSGNFGKVYRGTWRGTAVAVKCIVLPSSMSRSAHAERMALMEAAISSSMHHPHLVQTYTYSIKPIKDSASFADDSDLMVLGPVDSWTGTPQTPTAGPPPSSDLDSVQWSAGPDVHSFEIQLVLEFCDGGSLDEILKAGGFHSEKGLNFGGILDTAADVAKGMLHLHMNEILHSDLKAGNVIFKAGGDDGRGVIAKVVDFGLAIQLDVSGNQTHVSKMFQGTPTHMAPEVLLEGKQSKAADVYAFGILLFELYTGSRPYLGIATALLGHHVAREGRRPQFTSFTPKGYRDLAERCWQADPDARPTFNQILDELLAMRSSYPASRPITRPAATLPLSPLHPAAPRPRCASSLRVHPPGDPSSSHFPSASHRDLVTAHSHLLAAAAASADPPSNGSLHSLHSRDGDDDELDTVIVLTDFRHRSLVRVALVPIPENQESIG